MPARTRFTFALLAAALLPSLALADEPKGKGDEKPAAAAPAPAPPAPRKFVSEHRLQAGGVDLAYTATAEEIQLKDGDGKLTASFFTISYVKSGVARPEERPITFVYNGGPGSASIFLHFGLVGPKRLDIPSDASDPGVAPWQLKDNPFTILRATDLVFVDPVGTGFSKALGEKKNADFWGYNEDADSVAEFIRTFITMKNRWNSPKFLLGESYGGIRSSLLVPRLQQQLSIGLNGVILISPAINMGMLPFVGNGNDMPYAAELPAMAAVANFHHKLPDAWPSEEALLAEVESYASGDYLRALFAGDRLSAAERDQVAERLHRYTGVSKEYALRSDLRIYAPRYCKELLRDQGKSIGILDGRYAQDELDDVAAFPDNDPFNAKTSPIYLASFESYLRNELKVDINDRFFDTNNDANQGWKRPQGNNGAFAGFVDVTGDLAQGTKDSDHLRVFAAAGHHDLATSFYATEYMLHHSGIAPAQLTIKEYDGGHMMYLYQPSLEKLSNDIVEFIGKK